MRIISGSFKGKNIIEPKIDKGIPKAVHKAVDVLKKTNRQKTTKNIPI